MGSLKINQRMAELGHSEIRAMTQACVAAGGLNLAQGVCDTPVPSLVLKAAADAMAIGKNTYSRFDGLPELRAALALKLSRDNEIQADPETEITVSAGATGAFHAACLALLNQGDEVILFEPFYQYHVSALLAVEAVPVVPGNVNVYVDSTFAGIGTTKLTRVLEATLSISDRISPLWVLNSSNGSFAATLETPPNVTGKLKMEANAAGMAYLSTIRAGSTVYIRIEAEGDALPAPDAGQNYLFRWDMAAKVESPDSMGDTDGAYTIDWTFRGVHDADMGGMLSVVLQNLATAL